MRAPSELDGAGSESPPAHAPSDRVPTTVVDAVAWLRNHCRQLAQRRSPAARAVRYRLGEVIAFRNACSTGKAAP